MKTKELLIGLGMGLLIGFAVCYVATGRYTVVHLANLYVVRMDKITGKTWWGGAGHGWQEISEPTKPWQNLPPGFIPEKPDPLGIEKKSN
jgi:hypothetical protein